MSSKPPVIDAEMDDWVDLGGENLGIQGDSNHTYGFHPGANEVPSSDYSRTRDPNGNDGPYVNWSYACAGDFGHRNDPRLRAMHADVLDALMNGKFPMICEFIGKPWPDRPVYYWARWNGVGNLQKYTGEGHDRWSHIAWYRSRVDERAHLWTGVAMDPDDVWLTNGIIRYPEWARDEPGAPEHMTPEQMLQSISGQAREANVNALDAHQDVEALAAVVAEQGETLARIEAMLTSMTPGGTLTVSGGTLTVTGSVTGSLTLADAD